MTDYLAAQGELSNTYIIYYTDNGYHWGEHRLAHGKTAPYDTDTGFPLLIRGPRIPAGTISSKLIGNHDIAPTFANMAGASTPSFVDGRNFLRIADADPSNDSPWRTGLYVEWRYKPEWPLPEQDAWDQYVPPYEAVREQNLLYIHYQDDPRTPEIDAGFREFYDLLTDPYELRNLVYYSEVSQATLDRLQGRLLRLRGCKADVCRTAENEPTIGTTPPTDPVPGPPRVISTIPTAGATGVAPSSNLTATFSEKMDPASITTSTFKLFRVNADGTQAQITNVTVSKSTDGLKATLNPFGTSTTLLFRNTKYKGVITTGARDVAGNPLDQIPTTDGLQMKAWTFTTVSP
jgi:hypothetical protein